MRAILLLALASLAVPAPAAEPLRLESLPPNARAAQRPLGPNAKAAQRPAGPNTAVMRSRERAGYPSCAALRAARAAPLHRGELGYGRHLDPDGDGIACAPR